MKTIFSAASNIVLKTYMGAALFSTIVIATYKTMNALQVYFAPFQQSALFEIMTYSAIILFCYGLLYLNSRNIFNEKIIDSKKSKNSTDVLMQNLINQFALGFLQGFESKAQQQTQENQNENTTADSYSSDSLLRSSR